MQLNFVSHISNLSACLSVIDYPDQHVHAQKNLEKEYMKMATNISMTPFWARCRWWFDIDLEKNKHER
jgi:hypothetical protein